MADAYYLIFFKYVSKGSLAQRSSTLKLVTKSEHSPNPKKVNLVFMC